LGDFITETIDDPVTVEDEDERKVLYSSAKVYNRLKHDSYIICDQICKISHNSGFMKFQYRPSIKIHFVSIFTLVFIWSFFSKIN